MDYELMMNGNVKIGQRAPEFEANTTMGRVSLNDYTRSMANFVFSSRRLYPRKILQFGEISIDKLYNFIFKRHRIDCGATG